MDFEGEIDEKCLLSKTKDTIFNSEAEVSGIKESEIGNDPNEVVTQGEMPVEQPNNPDDREIFSCLEQREEQLEEDIQGRVVVKFYVDTLGRVCEPKIVRGKDSALDREALRVVGLFPNFLPATMNGKKVNAYMTLPITFKLPKK